MGALFVGFVAGDLGKMEKGDDVAGSRIRLERDKNKRIRLDGSGCHNIFFKI